MIGSPIAKCGSTVVRGTNGARMKSVPLSPTEVSRKRTAIFKHQSQKDRALFPGPDMREFWKRAEDRNRDTAQLFDKLGLAEYEAIEGFVRWRGDAKELW
jgi:glucosamine-6-phosphate deaminase